MTPAAALLPDGLRVTLVNIELEKALLKLFTLVNLSMFTMLVSLLQFRKAAEKSTSSALLPDGLRVTLSNDEQSEKVLLKLLTLVNLLRFVTLCNAEQPMKTCEKVAPPGAPPAGSLTVVSAVQFLNRPMSW